MPVTTNQSTPVVDPLKVNQINKRIINLVERNLNTKQYSSTQLVTEIKKIIEEVANVAKIN